MLESWIFVGTIKDIENRLKDFKFKGEGWYTSTYQPDPDRVRRIYRKGQVDYLLVMKQQPEDLYTVYVYNGYDPRSQLRKMLEMEDK